MKLAKYPTKQYLRDKFNYTNGSLIWGENAPKKQYYKTNCGYNQIYINGKRYFEHRLVWIYFYGDIPQKMVIDHINHNRSDNKIENLRCITQKENTWNRKVKGYTQRNGKYIVKLKANRKDIYIGTFNTKEEALKARKEAKKIYHPIKEYYSIEFNKNNFMHGLYRGTELIGFYPRLTLAEQKKADFEAQI